jgi:hypothetical protein
MHSRARRLTGQACGRRRSIPRPCPAREDACARTYHLIDVTAPVAARLVAATRIPMLRLTVRDIATLVDDLRS